MFFKRLRLRASKLAMASLKGVSSWIDGTWKCFIREPPKKILQKRRTRIICTKLFFNVVYYLCCVYNLSIPDILGYGLDTMGRSYKVYLWTYVGICAGLPLFSFIGLVMEGNLVSQTWFEVAWSLGVSGFDVVLITEQKKYQTLLKETLFKSVDQDFWASITKTMYIITLAALAIDLGLSLFWSGSLLKGTWNNWCSYPGIWASHASDFPWLSENLKTPPDQFPSPARFVFGTPRQPPAYQSIPADLKSWLAGSTMFRRPAQCEPLSHSLLRGVVALLLWAVLVAYGIFTCVINPILQFYSTSGLPVKLLHSDFALSTFGPIYGYISGEQELADPQIPAFLSNKTESISPENCDALPTGVRVSVIDPSGGAVRYCQLYCSLWLAQGTHEWSTLSLAVGWDCGSIWDSSWFQTPASMPDLRPYVSVVYESLGTSSLSAALFGPVIAPDGSMSNWSSGLPNYGGMGLDLTPGQSVRVDVGRRMIYTNQAKLLDLIGISRRSDVSVLYPIHSLTLDAAPSTPSLTTLNFHAGFGAYNDEIIAEYLEHTVLSGLSAAGGLYTAFDVLFILVFGRSLLTALFGGRNIGPFGAIASILQTEMFREKLKAEYPGIECKDAQATCSFLHDFILDLKPLEIESKEALELPHGQNNAADGPA